MKQRGLDPSAETRAPKNDKDKSATNALPDEYWGCKFSVIYFWWSYFGAQTILVLRPRP